MNKKKLKAIIHIGGSHLQLPSIRWAKELGLYVIVTDRNPNAPGRSIADQFEVISGTDILKLIDLANQISAKHELVGAYTSNDFGLKAVAAISDQYECPGCSLAAVERALNKSLSKKLWQTENLPTPRGITIREINSLSEAIDKLGLPVIIKPIDSSGSQGVRSVYDHRDLIDAFKSAQQFSKTVLIEQLIIGHHIDVNGLFIENKFVPCGTMDRFFSDPPFHYPIWGCQPSSLTEEQENIVYALVERASRVLGIDAGPVKADVVWTDDGPVILELAPRFHGDVSTAHVTPLATLGNPIKTWITYLMEKGNVSEYLNIDVIQYAGWMSLFPSTSGTLVSVQGIMNAKAIKGMQKVLLSKEAGAFIKQVKDNSAVCGFLWAVAANRCELLEILSTARSSIEFIVE